MEMSREERKAALKKYMDALPCSACEYKETPRYPLTADIAICYFCHSPSFSGTLLHTCKTGWMHGVCDRCNSMIEE